MTETQERPKLRNDRETLRAVYTMMVRGMTTNEIAAHYNTPASSVSRLAPRRNAETALGMMELADVGWTLEEIGRTYNVSKQRVSQLIGPAPQVGSRGHVVTVDAAPETWQAMMDALEGVDIHVREIKGVDARALVVFMDGVRDGTYRIVRAATGPIAAGAED